MLANNESENIVLAGILKHSDAYWTINEVDLRVADFVSVMPRKIIKAILTVAGDRKTPEYPQVIEALKNEEESLAYIERLLKVPVSVPQAIENARIVKGLSTARQLQTAGAEIITIAEEKRTDSDAAIAEAESLIRKIRATLPSPEHSPDPGDILMRIQNPKDVGSIPIQFSPTLHRLTDGLQAGHLWVIGGFSSTGKTLAAENFIFDVLRKKKWVGAFSLEMTQEAYLVRLMAIASGIPQRTIKNRAFVGHDEVEKMARVERWLPSAPIRVYDTLYRLQDIRGKAIQQKETLGLDLMIVDFIQNVYVTGDEISDARATILELQNLAKELDCTVLALSQVSNEYAKSQNEGGRSGFYSFKGHGSIRDAADVGVMLKRDRYISPTIMDFSVVKNRHGELLDIPLQVDLRTGKLTEAYDLISDETEQSAYR